MSRATRSKTGALPQRQQAQTQQALDSELHAFGSLSLLSFATKSSSGSSGIAFEKHVSQDGSRFLQLPLDILALILTRCHPVDLLYLARTSQDLNRFLMSKRAMSIWLAARKVAAVTITPEDQDLFVDFSRLEAGTEALPACPSFLSEPACARLLFTLECTMCGDQIKKGSKDIRGCLLARLCKTCSTHLTNRTALNKAFGTDSVDKRFYDILPWADRYTTPPPTNKNAYYEPLCRTIFERASDYEMRYISNAAAVTAFYDKGEQELQERNRFFADVRRYQEAMSEWSEIEDAREEASAETNLIKNKEFIVADLSERGVDCRVSDIEDCEDAVDIVYDIRGLVNMDSFSKIRKEFIKMIGTTIQHRIIYESFYEDSATRFRQYVRARLDDLYGSDCLPDAFREARLPGIGDLLQLPAMLQLKDSAEFQEEESRTTAWERTLPSILQQIGSLRELWEGALVARFQAIAQSKRQAFTSNILRSPTTLFICQICDEGQLSYPLLLRHRCLQTIRAERLASTRNRLMKEKPEISDDPFESHISLSRLLALDPDYIAIHELQRRFDAIEAAGDPVPQSRLEMSEHKGRFLCTQCKEARYGHRSKRKTLLRSLAHVGMRCAICSAQKRRRDHCWHDWHHKAFHRDFEYLSIASQAEKDGYSVQSGQHPAMSESGVSDSDSELWSI